MKPLRVYVSATCRICDRTRQIVAEVRTLRPHYPIELVDLDLPGALKPAAVFGTPTYLLGERIISLGNPAPQILLDLLDAELTQTPGITAILPIPTH
ncbi:hypothetical protein EKD04_025270 [Chloroflexales bacterium ZM16-3]|nr:hypothetical protein [Chloroflexales bacterium ZM16-3]